MACVPKKNGPDPRVAWCIGADENVAPTPTEVPATAEAATPVATRRMVLGMIPRRLIDRGGEINSWDSPSNEYRMPGRPLLLLLLLLQQQLAALLLLR